MPRQKVMRAIRCHVCRHPKRVEIESRRMQGETKAVICSEYGFSMASFGRHLAKCGFATIQGEITAKARVDLQAMMVTNLNDLQFLFKRAVDKYKSRDAALLSNSAILLLDRIKENQGPDEASYDFTKDIKFLAAWNNALHALSNYPEAREAFVRAFTQGDRSLALSVARETNDGVVKDGGDSENVGVEN